MGKPNFEQYNFNPDDWNDLPSMKTGPMAAWCHESHPALKLGKGTLYGGSANHPKHDADIYVALEHLNKSRASYPWDAKQVVEISFPVQDTRAPKNAKEFKKMVNWLCNQLQEGKTVHIGCIGGHGRTGTLISAIVSVINKDKDAIKWVRENYCEKAVESKEQVQFLVKNFGVSPVKGAKEWMGTLGFPSRSTSIQPYAGSGGYSTSGSMENKYFSKTYDKKHGRSVRPVSSRRCLWRRKEA